MGGEEALSFDPMQFMYEVVEKASKYFERTREILANVDTNRAEECGRRIIGVVENRRVSSVIIALGYTAIKAASRLCGDDMDCVSYTVYSAFVMMIPPDLLNRIESDPVVQISVSERIRQVVEDVEASAANTLVEVIDIAKELEKVVSDYSPSEVLLAVASVLLTALQYSFQNELDVAVTLIGFAIFTSVIATGKLLTEKQRIMSELTRNQGVM